MTSKPDKVKRITRDRHLTPEEVAEYDNVRQQIEHEKPEINARIQAHPQFDPDFSPQHETNKEAAKARGLRYDPQRRMYVDAEGYLCRDKFGQPL